MGKITDLMDIWLGIAPDLEPEQTIADFDKLKNHPMRCPQSKDTFWSSLPEPKKIILPTKSYYEIMKEEQAQEIIDNTVENQFKLDWAKVKKMKNALEHIYSI